MSYGPEFICTPWTHGPISEAFSCSLSGRANRWRMRYIESFNGWLRDECLNEHWFLSLDHARRVIEDWRVDDNTARPHSSLGYLTPDEYASQEVEKLS